MHGNKIVLYLIIVIHNLVIMLLMFKALKELLKCVQACHVPLIKFHSRFHTRFHAILLLYETRTAL
jgi:hypothetical protein